MRRIGEAPRRCPAGFSTQPGGPDAFGRPLRRPACAMRRIAPAPPSYRTTKIDRRNARRDTFTPSETRRGDHDPDTARRLRHAGARTRRPRAAVRAPALRAVLTRRGGRDRAARIAAG